MVEYEENEYAAELREKPICRFCLTQNDALTNIYSSKANSNPQVSLSMQVMACVSIEVFADDEMPSTICYPCRLLMDFCYRFKQMCKKSDTLLKQYPLTGIWPERLEHPKFPIKLIQTMKTMKSDPEPKIAQPLKRKLPQSITISTPSKRLMTAHNDNDIPIEDMVVEFADETIISETIPQPPKILNTVKQVPVKILNKQASNKSVETVLRQPVIKTNEDGKIEVVSKVDILESEETEIDPIKNAALVETNVFPCNFCERSFPLRQLFDIHVANHVRDRKFQCNTCNKGFFSKYDLGKHELIHTGEKPFVCVVCGKAFSRLTLLRRHEKVHSDQPKFLCAYCERPFLSKEEWEKHTQNHQKKRPFNCDICGKSFAFKQGLERHEVVHSQDQPFKCEHCDQGFSTQGKLARHLTAHAGNRPYPCRICDKSYLLSHHLTRHMRSHKENNQIIHKCVECDLSFSKRDELITPSTVHATENLVCPLCKTTFDDVNEVSDHIKQHSQGEQFGCEFCDLIFLTESQLHEHSDTQHLEEIELYDMSNTNVDCLDEAEAEADGNAEGEFTNIKPEVDTEDYVEYSEQVEVITPEVEEYVNEEPLKYGANSRNYGKTNVKKEIQTQKLETGKDDKSPTKTANVSRESHSKYAAKISSNTERSPNTRASNINTRNIANSNKTMPEKPINTRSNKVSPNKVPSSNAKKSPSQTSLTKFLTIKQKSDEHAMKTSTPKQVTPLPTLKTSSKDDSKTTEIKVANKLVKVKQIRMTKAQIEQMTKDGKIELRGGQVIFKKK